MKKTVLLFLIPLLFISCEQNKSVEETVEEIVNEETTTVIIDNAGETSGVEITTQTNTEQSSEDPELPGFEELCVIDVFSIINSVPKEVIGKEQKSYTVELENGLSFCFEKGIINRTMGYFQFDRVGDKYSETIGSNFSILNLPDNYKYRITIRYQRSASAELHCYTVDNYEIKSWFLWNEINEIVMVFHAGITGIRFVPLKEGGTSPSLKVYSITIEKEKKQEQ
ncbi:MAG: hypothetical protein J6T20_08605 [Treponema sp.]|nr:hypothetical protein [Treponema sp.]